MSAIRVPEFPRRKYEEKNSGSRVITFLVWPDLIRSLISGLRSGLSSEPLKNIQPVFYYLNTKY